MKTTRQRILNEGLNLVSRAGLAGVTLGVLAQQSGMSKSGLFAHFGSKEDVQLNLLAETGRVATSTFIEKALAQPAGIARLTALFEGWLGWSKKAGLPGGCPLTAGMFELDDVEADDPVRQQLVTIEQQWRSLLVQLIHEAVGCGELRSDLDAEQVVWELCGIYLAHHTFQRFIQDPLATRRAMTAFQALVLRSSAAEPPKKRSRYSRNAMLRSSRGHSAKAD